MIVDVIKTCLLSFLQMATKNTTIGLRVICDPGKANDDTETQLTKIHKCKDILFTFCDQICLMPLHTNPFLPMKYEKLKYKPVNIRKYSFISKCVCHTLKVFNLYSYFGLEN